MSKTSSSQAVQTAADRRIYLLRHGSIQSTGDHKRYIGQLDLPLSDIGRGQALRWADYFANRKLEAIVCSDLSRCRETAAIIGDRCALRPRPYPALREIDLGAWDGKRFDTIKTRFPDDFQKRGQQIADHRPPGGESFRDLQHRVEPFFEQQTRQHPGPILMVTHAGVIRVLLCRLLGMPLANLFAIGQSYGTLTIVAKRTGGYRLQALTPSPPR
jgi:probable phosphoglycerate mutase